MNLDARTILLLVTGGGIIQGLFVAALLLNRPAPNARANRILAALMVLCSLNIVHPFLSLVWALRLPSSGVRVNEPLQFLLAPLVAAYVRNLLAPETRFTPRDLLHALPAVGVVGFTISRAAARLEALTAFPLVSIGLWALLLVQAALYFAPLVGLLHAYRARLREEVSNFTGIDPGWISLFLILILGLYLVYAVFLVLLIHIPRFSPTLPYLPIVFSILVWALGYRGLTQKAPQVGAQEAHGAQAAVSGPKYERSSVPEAEAEEIAAGLQRAMHVDRLFLNPDLRLSDLAAHLGKSRNQLSFVINGKMGKSFYDFINEYRVNEVMALMKDPGRADEKLLSLAFDAGFNSKPSFNNVFKKLTGMTPSQFRDRLENRVSAVP